MEITTTLSGETFSAMLNGGADTLSRHRQRVNDLNVFPIPDGDTGDNMLMTFGSGARAAQSAGTRLCDTANAAAHGMLLGARGNSGVILSRIFSGITREFSELESADTAALMRGMCRGVEEAYRAVPKPVEGTILTVFRDAVEYANRHAAAGGTIRTYFDDLLTEMKRSLDRTPELLPVLSEAGVVDSGGAGLLCIFEGMRNSLLGLRADPTEKSVARNPTDENAQPDFSLFGPDSVLTYGYCTEFLLRLQNAKTDIAHFDLPGLIAYLEEVGSSVVAFREDSIVKVHVHTAHPGQILEYCQQYGEFLTLKVENMTFQNEEAVRRGNNAQAAVAKKPKKKNAIVAVAAGKGIKDTFASLGVDAVVDGGQSMNPAAADFLRAFREVNAGRIFVFPNNGNVIMTARQAASLYKDAEIVIIPSRTIGEGYAAISMMETEGESEAILKAAEEVIAGVKSGFVSRASRNAHMGGINVCSGDYIGFSEDAILSDSRDRETAAEELAARMQAGEYGVLLLIAGTEAKADSARSLCDHLSAAYPSTEVILIDGGQPIYDYMLVFE